MIEDHEKASAMYADDFLKSRSVDNEDRAVVRDCILATRYPQQPQSILGEIICDADLIHLGQKDFFEKTALVREEWRLTRDLDFGEENWLQLNLEFMMGHSFYTSYCQEKYEKRKMKNTRKAIKMLALQKYDVVQFSSVPTI